VADVLIWAAARIVITAGCIMHIIEETDMNLRTCVTEPESHIQEAVLVYHRIVFRMDKPHRNVRNGGHLSIRDIGAVISTADGISRGKISG